MSIENRSLKLPHSSGVLCGQKRSIFGEGIAQHVVLYSKARKYVDTIGSDTSAPLARGMASAFVAISVRGILTSPTMEYIGNYRLYYKFNTESPQSFIVELSR